MEESFDFHFHSLNTRSTSEEKLFSFYFGLEKFGMCDTQSLFSSRKKNENSSTLLRCWFDYWSSKKHHENFNTETFDIKKHIFHNSCQDSRSCRVTTFRSHRLTISEFYFRLKFRPCDLRCFLLWTWKKCLTEGNWLLPGLVSAIEWVIRKHENIFRS